MRKLLLLKLLLFIIFITSCGEGTVLVTNESYEPKIVIEGFLIANQKVEKIRITRNFRINENLNRTNLIPDVYQTLVTITDVEKNRTYHLSFHVAETNDWTDYYWEYKKGNLTIDYGKTYRLDVSAKIEGKELRASSTTTVPQQGFKIAALNYDSLSYRQRDENGNILNFEMTINRSPGTTFYLMTTEALNATEESLIYDNPFEDVTSEDIDINIDKFDYRWIQNTPTTPGQSKIEIFWNDLMFYGEYRAIVYAADRNYLNFLQTFNSTQEEDGNFHEPKFNIEGDGIGVFGSMIADTIYFNVLTD